MDKGYSSALQRLKEEREKWNLTQRMLCYHMKIQQSRLSKAETGNRYFSYHELEGLCTSDVDVFYVFTGKRPKNPLKFLDPLKVAPEELMCYLNVVYLLASAVKGTNRDNTAFSQIRQQLEYIQYCFGNIEPTNNIFYRLRNRYDYTQQKMANVMGMDIKKLQRLEKGVRLPDSEVIWKMYDLFHVSPAFVLRDAKGLWNELNYELELLDDNDREVMAQILENAFSFMRPR